MDKLSIMIIVSGIAFVVLLGGCGRTDSTLELYDREDIRSGNEGIEDQFADVEISQAGPPSQAEEANNYSDAIEASEAKSADSQENEEQANDEDEERENKNSKFDLEAERIAAEMLEEDDVRHSQVFNHGNAVIGTLKVETDVGDERIEKLSQKYGALIQDSYVDKSISIHVMQDGKSQLELTYE